MSISHKLAEPGFGKYLLHEAHGDIFWYIEAFYNRKRRHQALCYLSPAEFKRRYLAKIAA